ncbi:MAG: beta-propeller repeat-containing protein [Ignavibacteria bacterium]|nr:beta-propeller repeat-containing protein [Ignavibacteria bacterium]
MKNRFALLCLFCLITLLVIISCQSTPTTPTDTGEIPSKITKAAFILAEGLWEKNNSSITLYNFPNSTVYQNFYGKANPNLVLGDGANDIVLHGDTAFVAVSNSHSIDAFRISTGKFVGRIRDSSNFYPRKICIINDSSAFFTDAFSNCIYQFNPKNFTFNKNKILVGPAPELITSIGNKILIANSAWGDLYADKPKAGTISVIDANTKIEIANLKSGENTVEVISAPNKNRFYTCYYNLPSKKDSGGIVEYDGETLMELRRWHLNSTHIKLNSTSDILYYIGWNGIYSINLNEISPKPLLLIPNNKSDEFWYTFSITPDDSRIWIGNAKDYSVAGEVLVYDIKATSFPLFKFDCGINPNTIVFYGY